jgi:hypothetical protein
VVNPNISADEFAQPTLPFPPVRHASTNPWEQRWRWGGPPAHGEITEEFGGGAGDSDWEISRFQGLVHRGPKFAPGDVVMPAENHGRGTNFDISSPQHAYVSDLKENTIWERFGDRESINQKRTVGESWLGANASRVRPLSGSLSDDPNMEGRRSRVGFEVLGDAGQAEETTVDVAPIMRGYFRTMKDF